MLYLYKPFIPDLAIEDIQETLSQGPLVYAKKGREFEEKFSEYIGVNSSCAVSSGTAALHIALLALEISHEDLVFVPDFTWSSSVNVVEIVGAKPIFIDIDLKTQCMDLLHLEKKLKEHTGHKGKKLIMPVHQHGYPMNMSKISELSKVYDCFVVEDAACAIGSEHNKKKIGSFSDISCFSFHPRKVLTTGEGGMVCTDNSIFSDRIRRFANHGFQSDMKEYLFPGLNYRLTEIQSILGIRSLDYIEEIIFRRKELKNIYFRYLKEFPFLHLPDDNEGHNWQTFLVVLDSSIDRNNFLAKLNSMGINAVRSSNSLCSLPYFINKYGENTQVENSKKVASQGLALPFCDSYGKDQVEQVFDALKKLV
tara:strand:+ start:11340 stop:12437 length:1098 start_codon:yes stop_codon:yes gene_type:complete